MSLTAIRNTFAFMHVVSHVQNSLWDKQARDSLNAQLSPMCFQPVFEEMYVNNFGRIIAYLTFAYRLSDSCDEETIQEAVRRTVEAFRLIDLEKYKLKRFISFKALLG